MDFFKNLFVGSIVDFIEEIYLNITSAATASSLVKTLDGYNQNIYNTIVSANKYISGLGYIVLAFFMLQALYNVSIRPEGGSNTPISSFYTPAKVIIKTIIGKIFIDNSLAITVGLYDTGISLISGLASATIKANSFDDSAKNQIREIVQNMEIGERISLWSSLMIISLLVKLSCVLVEVIVMGRFLEIYVMIAFSPIPLATLVGEHEILSIGFSFLKKFIAVVLQGAVMWLVLAMFSTMFIGTNMTINPDNFQQSVNMCLKLSLVLVFAVWQSGAWARSITNAI